MKFDKSVNSNHRKALEQALDTVHEKGNDSHRLIARTLIDSDILIRMLPLSEMPGSGMAGVIDPAATNRRIRKERLSVKEAMAEVYICFADWTLDTCGQRCCQGTFVHEGQHAYDFAQAISSFSQADLNPIGLFNPTLYQLEWEAHVNAADYMLLIGQEDFLWEGRELMMLGEINGKHYLNEKGIKKRLNNSYGLQENGNQGPTASELLALKIRE